MAKLPVEQQQEIVAAGAVKATAQEMRETPKKPAAPVDQGERVRREFEGAPTGTIRSWLRMYTSMPRAKRKEAYRRFLSYVTDIGDARLWASCGESEALAPAGEPEAEPDAAPQPITEAA